jgi:hypothetical protein
MFFSNEERKKEILKFVKQNPGITKSKVIVHMTELRMSSLVITQELLTALIRSGKIRVQKDKPNSRNHRLFFNDKNEFNKLTSEIARLEDTSSKFIDIFIKELLNKDAPKTEFKEYSTDSKRHLFNLVFLYQLDTYTRITAHVNEIEQTIKSQDDRQALYHLLPHLLIISDKLNRVITPEIRNSKQLEYIKKSIMAK